MSTGKRIIIRLNELLPYFIAPHGPNLIRGPNSTRNVMQYFGNPSKMDWTVSKQSFGQAAAPDINWFSCPLNLNTVFPEIPEKLKAELKNPPKSMVELINEPWRFQPPDTENSVSRLSELRETQGNIFVDLDASTASPIYYNILPAGPVLSKAISPENFQAGDFTSFISAKTTVPELYVATSLFSPTQELPVSPWECPAQSASDGKKPPLRTNARGDVECMSTDGVHCLWSHPTDCEKLVRKPPKDIKPGECPRYPPRSWCTWIPNKLELGIIGVYMVIETDEQFWLKCCAGIGPNGGISTLARSFCPTQYNDPSALACVDLGNRYCASGSGTALTPICGCYPYFIEKEIVDKSPALQAALKKLGDETLQPLCTATCQQGLAYMYPDLKPCEQTICDVDIKGNKLNVKVLQGCGDRPPISPVSPSPPPVDRRKWVIPVIIGGVVFLSLIMIILLVLVAKRRRR